MKQQITRYELDLLDAVATSAHEVHQAHQSIGNTQARLAEAMSRLLLVDGWDQHKREAIEQYVRDGAPHSLEQFVERLGVAIYDPLFND